MKFENMPQMLLIQVKLISSARIARKKFGLYWVKSKSSETSNSQNEASIIKPAAIIKQTIVEYCAVIMLVCHNLVPFYCYCQLVVRLFKAIVQTKRFLTVTEERTTTKSFQTCSSLLHKCQKDFKY